MCIRDRSGSGDVILGDVRTEHLEVAIAGSGDVWVAGVTAEQEIRLSGSGSYDAAELGSQAAKIKIAGSGDAEIHATETLNAQLSGSGEIKYRGKPNITSRVSGSGGLIALEAR